MKGWEMAASLLIGHAWSKLIIKMSIHPQRSLDLYVMVQTVCQCSFLVMVQGGLGGQMQQKEWPSFQVLLLEHSRSLCREIIGEKNHWDKQILQALSLLQYITVTIKFMILI